MKTCTQWFDEYIHPKYSGVYETESALVGYRFYSYFENGQWYFNGFDIERAIFHYKTGSTSFPKQWRGIAK